MRHVLCKSSQLYTQIEIVEIIITQDFEKFFCYMLNNLFFNLGRSFQETSVFEKKHSSSTWCF